MKINDVVKVLRNHFSMDKNDTAILYIKIKEIRGIHIRGIVTKNTQGGWNEKFVSFVDNEIIDIKKKEVVQFT